MKLIKIKRKDRDSIDSVVQRKSYNSEDDRDESKLHQAEQVWYTFAPFRRRRARTIRFVFEDQWGDLITVNGKTMTQREYLTKQGNIALQANLMANKANSIVGSHIKEGALPSLHAIRREDQALGEVLSETLRANWEVNDMVEIESQSQFELLFGGLAVEKESFERLDGEDDAWSRMVNPNMFAFSSSMQDPRLKDLSMTVELHDYTFNELCAAFVTNKDDYKKLKEWYEAEASPLKLNDLVNATEKIDEERVLFYSPTDTACCRVIEVWTKERRLRYHVFDPQRAELYDINADDTEMIKTIEQTNKERIAEGKRLGYSDDEIPVIEYKEHAFVDTFWFFSFLTPTGYILAEGESELPGRTHPYSITVSPFVNGKICGYLYDAVDLQIAINRELVIYDWMKRLDTKGVTFVPQSIIPDGMDYKTFAEQWTSMDGIVFYKPNNNNDRPIVEHGGGGRLNTAEMIKMLSDTMSESVSVSGAIQGKTPYAGTSAALYAQQKENSTTPIAVVASKLETFIKHIALKKTAFIQMYYPLDRYADVAGGMQNIDLESLDLSKISTLKHKFKYILGADHTSLRQESNDLLLSLLQMGAMNVNDVLSLGEFSNADAIINTLNQRAMEAQQQQLVEPNYDSKRQAVKGA